MRSTIGRYSFGDTVDDVLMESVDLNDNVSWRLLLPTARAQLARRVVVLGAARSGRTTLACDLARHFRTVYVPRYSASYWAGRRHTRGAAASDAWSSDEFATVARGQLRQEDDLARRALKLVVADTAVLSIMAWEKLYRGTFSRELEELAATCEYDLYVLTKPDFPDVVDEGDAALVGPGEGEVGSLTSDGVGSKRDERHYELKAMLHSRGLNYIVVSGTPEDRAAVAAAAIVPLLEFPTRFERRAEVTIDFSENVTAASGDFMNDGDDNTETMSVVSDYREDWVDPRIAAKEAEAASGVKKWDWLHPEKSGGPKIILTDDQDLRRKKREWLLRTKTRTARLHRTGKGGGIASRGSILNDVRKDAMGRAGRKKKKGKGRSKMQHAETAKF